MTVFNYNEYTLNDISGRLEYFRGAVGSGQLYDDLGVAIECIDYIIAMLRKEDVE